MGKKRRLKEKKSSKGQKEAKSSKEQNAFHKVAKTDLLAMPNLIETFTKQGQENDEPLNLAAIFRSPDDFERDVLTHAIEYFVTHYKSQPPEEFINAIQSILNIISSISSYQLRFSPELWGELEELEDKRILEKISQTLQLDSASYLKIMEVITGQKIPLEETKTFCRGLEEKQKELSEEDDFLIADFSIAGNSAAQSSLFLSGSEESYTPTFSEILEGHIEISEDLLKILGEESNLKYPELTQCFEGNERLNQEILRIMASKFTALISVISDRFNFIPESTASMDYKTFYLTLLSDLNENEFTKTFLKFYNQTTEEEQKESATAGDTSKTPEIQYTKETTNIDDPIEKAKKVIHTALTRYLNWQLFLQHLQEKKSMTDISEQEKTKLNSILLNFHPEELFEFMKALHTQGMTTFDVEAKVQDEDLRPQLTQVIINQIIKLVFGNTRLSVEIVKRCNECADYSFDPRLHPEAIEEIEQEVNKSAIEFLAKKYQKPIAISDDDAGDKSKETEEAKESDKNAGKSIFYRGAERFLHRCGVGKPISGREEAKQESGGIGI